MGQERGAGEQEGTTAGLGGEWGQRAEPRIFGSC